jgi:hypothetical protein
MSDNTHQNTLINTINGLQAIGNTPLVGTLYEAYRYMEGLGESFGKYADVSSCATTSTAPSNSYTPVYQSPVVAANASCTHNYVVFLTDGLPNESPELCRQTDLFRPLRQHGRQGLHRRAADPVAGPVPHRFDDQRRYLPQRPDQLHEPDAPARPPRPPRPTRSRPTSSRFGVDPCLLLGFNYISAAAQAGGGTAYSVQSGDDLIAAFDEITTQVLAVNTSFTAPTVALNAFKPHPDAERPVSSRCSSRTRTTTGPATSKHYTLSNSGTTAGQIVDSKGNLAVSNGFHRQHRLQRLRQRTVPPMRDGYTTAVNDGANVQSRRCRPAAAVLAANATYSPTSTAAPPIHPRSRSAPCRVRRSRAPRSPAPPAARTQATSTSTYQLSTGNTLLTSTVMGIPASDTTTKAADVIDFRTGCGLLQCAEDERPRPEARRPTARA